MHSKLDKVIVNKACGELSLLVKSTTCTFGPDQSCNFKQKSKFMKQNKTFFASYQSKQNSTQNSFKKCKKFINRQTGPNQRKSQILFDKKRPPKKFIRKTLRIGTYLGK